MQHVNGTNAKPRVPFGDAVCPAAALLPFFGFFGFLLMAKRSGRERYARFARIYAGASTVLLLVYLLYRAAELSFYRHSVSSTMPVECSLFLFWFGGTGRMAGMYEIENVVMRSVIGYGEVLLPVLRTLLYLGCTIHTAVCIPGYVRYLREAVYPYRPEGEAQRLPRRKRLRLSLWMLWCLVPVFGYAAPLYAARITGNRRVRRICIALLCISAACLLLTFPEYSMYMYLDTAPTRLIMTVESAAPRAVLFVLVSAMRCCLSVSPLVSYLLSVMMRPEATEASAAAWLRDTAAHPSVADAKWRFRNSLWQFLTLLPCIGGLGLVVGGTGARNRRMIRAGLLHLGGVVLFAVPMILLYYAGTRNDGYSLYDPLVIFLGGRYAGSGLRGIMQQNGFYLLWCFGIMLGSMYHREALRGRAEALGGCRSGIDREIRLTKRFLSLGAVPAMAAAGGGFVTPDPIDPQPQREPTDLNGCSAPELNAIPGMTSDAAARVLRYRDAHGEIRSAEELIDVLSVKPHRAARILENVMLSASGEGAEESAAFAASVAGESRRRIDL